MKKILAITMGDPGGIGPEVIARALSVSAPKRRYVPLVIGNLGVMRKAMKLAGVSPALQVLSGDNGVHPSREGIFFLDIKTGGSFRKKGPTREGGIASVHYIRKAVGFAMEGKVESIVTGPISKEALKMAGVAWPGHTEMLADLTRTKNYAMVLAGGPLKVILVTTHTAMKNLPSLITKKRVLDTIRLAQTACDMLRIKDPRIAVAGLNPHAGEAGIFGDEEIKKILPAVEEASGEGIPVSGPFPPDTIFHKAYRGETDIVVCMYHDQGLIPMKMIAFDRGVNFTVGLPFVRTSPDHGTAYDIAWKGTANPSSMIHAIRMAVRLRI